MGLEELNLLTVFSLAFFASAFFSATEAAYLTLGKIDVNRLFRLKSKSSIFPFALPLFFYRHLGRFLAVVLLGNYVSNMISTLAAAQLFQNHLAGWFEIELGFPRPLPDILFVAGFTLLVLVFAEFVPKRMAYRFSQTFAITSSPIVAIIFFLVYPFFLMASFMRETLFSLVRNEKNNYFLKKTENQENENYFDEEEVRRELLGFVMMGSKSGALHSLEGELLKNILEYIDKPISTFLIPRDEIKGIDLEQLNRRNTLNKLRKFPHNYIPLYKKHIDNIEGILSKRKLAFISEGVIKEIEKVPRWVNKPLLLPESKNVIEALIDIFAEKSQAALVTDEYGGIEGMVTYEDITRKIFEAKFDRGGSHENIKKLSQHTFHVEAVITLNDFNRYFSTNVQCKHAETLAGYLLEKFQRLPLKDEKIKDAFFKYKIIQSNPRRIKKVMLEKIKR